MLATVLLIWRFIRSLVAAGAATMGLALAVMPASAVEPVRLNIIGGLGGINQYTKLEEPFWRKEITEISKGRITATVHPFDRSGFPGSEMLDLIQSGVVGFGTALLSLSSGDDPELNAVDHPGLNPDFETLRLTTSLYRPHLETILRERYNAELLGIYTYPQQVLFCTKPFAGINQLKDLRIRTSSVSQSELVAALGAIPVKMAFAEVVGAARKGVVDCAITGTLSGNEIGLIDATTHISPIAITSGLSVFVANRDVWQNLPEDVRGLIRGAVATLEARIWDAAERETANGLACNIGAGSCQGARKGSLTLVPATAEQQDHIRRMFLDAVFPSWLHRCGDPCRAAWNRTVGPGLGMIADPELPILLQTNSKTRPSR